MRPNECKYCGCDKFNADSVSMTRFCCGSSYWPQDEMWQIANGCAAKCAVQLVELRARVEQDIELIKAREANVVTALRSRLRTLNDRIQRAVEVLEAVTRFDVIPWDGGVSRDPSDGGGEVDADIVDQVIEILEGETDGKAD